MPVRPDTLSLRQLNRATLARQMLLARAALPPITAIERLAGMQAQQAAPPHVGLWSRLVAFERPALLRLLHDRKVVRAPLMRATLHLASARDFLAWRPAIQPALAAAMAGALRARASTLDLPAVLALGRRLLAEGPLDMDALRKQLSAAVRGGDERAMAYALRTHLPLVQVPTDDRWGFPAAATFALAERWLDRPVSSDPTPATGLVRSYLGAFGPASVVDATAWSGHPALAPAFASLRRSLRVLRDADGRELFDLPDAPRPPADSDAPVRFLPDFDNLVLGHADRRRMIADAHRPRLVTRNLLVRATVLVDGFVAGLWKTERRRDTATLTIEPFGALSRAEIGGLEQEGARLLRFIHPEAVSPDVRVARPARR